MRFDLASFLIGFVIAAIIALVLYRLRALLGAMRGSTEARIGLTGRFLSNSAETRYFQELAKIADQYHIGGDKVGLTDVYVEPRFIAATEPIDLEETARVGSVFHVVPQIHDLPAIYSAYNINTLSINDLQSGDRHLVLLGMAGIGKSSALAIMALYARSLITLQGLEALAEQAQLDEDKDLSENERAERLKIRQEQHERALAQLRISQEREADALEKKNIAPRVPDDFTKLLPILVHIRDVDLSPESYGGKTGTAKLTSLDPAEPLVRAVTRRFSTIAANTVPRLIYNRLNDGSCLVLLDGFDELSMAQWPEKLAWLEEFKALYGQNFIVITGPVEGYDVLLNAGFTPLFVRPWSDADFERLITRWSEAWPLIGGTRRAPASVPDDKLLRRTMTNNRGRTALDVTLKTWAAFAGDEQQTGRRGAYDFYVRAQLDNADQQRAALALIAADVLDSGGGLISRERIKTVITPFLTGDNGKPVTNISDFADRLIAKNGLLTDAPANNVLFRHPLLTGFLAAESLTNAPAERLADVAMRPAWEVALPFAAAAIPVEAAIRQRLGAPPDLLFSNLFDLARWLPDAASDAPWRADVLKRLSAALLAPTQYLALRERAAAALVTSRDKGVLYVLRQGLRSTDPSVRRLSCIGLGALGDPEAIKDLEPLLADSDPDVQLSAGLALGAISSDTALERMLNGLYTGDETLQRAIAEALAAIPGGGHEALREAIRSDDMNVRRAAVFGLNRVNAPWSLSLLYRVLLEDGQWYVRSAAEQAFAEAEKPQGSGPVAHPDADSLHWLVAWAASIGEGVPSGPNARQVLIHALQEGDPLHRAAAALTLAYIGYVPGLKPLYGALRDKDENVRGTVYEALAALQIRLGQPLPAV